MKLRKNIIAQVLYQILILVIPLILSKYVTNIINKDTLGIYSHSYAIASFFVIFAMLGIQKYGTREISKTRGDIIRLRKTFWSLMILHMFFSVLSLLAYFVFILTIKSNISIFIIQGIYVFSALFDITWLFYGIEDFSKVIFRNIIIKIIEITLILTLVKNNDDLWIYTLIMTLSVFLGQAIMVPVALRTLRPIKIHKDDLIPHIKPLLILSITVIATSVYSIFDKVLLGILSPGKEGDVALYEYADKIIKIPLSILAAVETVLLPRFSILNEENKENEIREKINNSIILISFVSIGCMFGIISIAKCFVSIWYGQDYFESANIMIALSPLIFIVSFGDIIRSQYLIPKKKDIQYTITIISGMIINLILNIVLIPTLGVSGAVIGTLCAEISICFLQYLFTIKSLPIFKYILEIIPFIIFGFIMLLINQLIIQQLTYNYNTLIIIIILGFFSYSLLSFVYLFFSKKNLLKQIIKRRR